MKMCRSLPACEARMRPCAGCGRTDVDFYASIPKWCKSCWRAKVKKNRMEKIEYYREYDRKRTDNPDRVEARRAYAIMSRTDADRKQAAKDRRSVWLEKNDAKRTAHVIVGNAIRDGRLKVSPCERCGYAVGVHGHHEDYSKPLEVKWLCRKCHGLRHREINEERRKTA